MRLPEIFASNPFVVSIEIFPPKTEAGEEALRKHLQTLVTHNPSFVSCTYGAGGSTQAKTVSWCREILNDLERPAVAHFTCVNSTREQLNQWLDEAQAAGIRNIMALRGDPPQGQETFEAVDGGLSYANELVELVRSHPGQFGIGVAGYPEKHIQAPSLEVDLQNLKRKVDAGADAVFTQLFFDNECFYRFRDSCHELGISCPVVPGIMPITDFARIKRITSMCGSRFPAELSSRLETVQDDADAQFEIGVEHAIRQCEDLRNNGVPGIHFYALNKSQACQRILEALGT